MEQFDLELYVKIQFKVMSQENNDSSRKQLSSACSLFARYKVEATIFKALNNAD